MFLHVKSQKQLDINESPRFVSSDVKTTLSLSHQVRGRFTCCEEVVALLCSTGTFQLWGHPIQVDWAEPERDVDEEVMQRVRVLYVSVRQLQQREDGGKYPCSETMNTAQSFSSCFSSKVRE